MTFLAQHPGELLLQSAEARKAGDQAGACALLREYVLRDRALLWLAKLSDDPAEALAAAALALHLAPDDEIVQRAIVAVREQAGALHSSAPDSTNIAAAITLDTGMTYQQACAVNWPFKQLNRPIGDLLAAKTIRLRDLAFAVEDAYDSKVRNAARTILITHLVGNEPKHQVRPLRVLPGGRYTERQERRSLLFGAMIATIGLLLSALLIFGGIYAFLTGNSALSSVLLIVVAPLAWLSTHQVERLSDAAQSYRLGRWGEDAALESLRNLLTDDWTVIRNLVLPQRIGGDIDLVLVGPGGIWALEVKAYTGTIRNIGDTWERSTKKGWRRLTTNPGTQARRNAANLKTFLTQQGLPVNWVEPAIIWAGDEANDDETGTLTLKDPATRVWRTRSLIDDAEELHQTQRRFTSDQVDAILSVLRQAVEDNRQSQRRSDHGAKTKASDHTERH